MAAELNVTIFADVTGLGVEEHYSGKGLDGVAPTGKNKQYRTLAAANSDEVLGVGDISTVTGLLIKAITEDLDVDLDYVSAFDADFTLKAGEPAAYIPNPAGIVRVKNNVADKTPVFEYLMCGTT